MLYFQVINFNSIFCVDYNYSVLGKYIPDYKLMLSVSFWNYDLVDLTSSSCDPVFLEMF